ncbi:MarR family winged helix-turn-helix transcriptional regulator [Streptomyces sp. NPDC012623]|uniref:MarR family winged helix-turn-helix transcriptional regulator n=1 Tax=unclassified Streptomyces TaxID=2593676 RepID=UPI0036B2B899
MAKAAERAMQQDKTWRQISQAYTLVTADLERELFRRHQLRLSEFHALSSLAEAVEGSLRMQDLADAVALNQSSVTRIVARLETQGLCERCLCPEDRRGIFTRIHEAGRRKVAEAAATYHETVTAACARRGITIDAEDGGYRLTVAGR